jgi:hypothetical protein
MNGVCSGCQHGDNQECLVSWESRISCIWEIKLCVSLWGIENVLYLGIEHVSSGGDQECLVEHKVNMN